MRYRTGARNCEGDDCGNQEAGSRQRDRQHRLSGEKLLDQHAEHRCGDELGEDEEPTFPYEPPRGTVAGLAVEDGTRRWQRSGDDVCDPLASEEVAVLCRTVLQYPSANGLGTKLTERFERVDPATGETDFAIDLEPGKYKLRGYFNGEPVGAEERAGAGGGDERRERSRLA